MTRKGACDAMAILGLGMIAGGLGWIWPPLAPITIGAALLVAGLMRAAGHRR